MEEIVTLNTLIFNNDNNKKFIISQIMQDFVNNGNLTIDVVYVVSEVTKRSVDIEIPNNLIIKDVDDMIDKEETLNYLNNRLVEEENIPTKDLIEELRELRELKIDVVEKVSSFDIIPKTRDDYLNYYVDYAIKLYKNDMLKQGKICDWCRDYYSNCKKYDMNNVMSHNINCFIASMQNFFYDYPSLNDEDIDKNNYITIFNQSWITN